MSLRAKAAAAAAALLHALAPAVAQTGASVPPTWARDVAPIVHRHCATCHRADGAAPFALDTFEEARARARTIARVTADGKMPPWLPAPGPPFAEERRLSADEIAILARWSDAGAPAGDTSEAPPPLPRPSGWRLGAPDLVLEMAEPFALAGGGDDVFRSFVLPLPDLGAPRRWVGAVEILPGDARVVHHGTLLVDATDSSRRLDAVDAVPGFDGMSTYSRARAPAGHLVGWTPGKMPQPADPTLAWELRQGSDLVLELHLVPSGREESVRARVGLHFAAAAPARRPLSIRLGRKTIDIAPGAAAHRVEDAFRLPAPADLLAIYPHAHFVCKSVTATATLPDGRVETLLEIPDWDFAWQDQYRYREPIALPAGADLRVAFVYDNSSGNPRNPHRPPRRVVYGPGSGDEMGDLWLQVVPRDPDDFALLARALERREREESVAGWRAAVKRAPDDATLRFNLGSELVLLDALEEGVAELERAVELDPGLAAAHTNLGNALVALAGQSGGASARGHLERAAACFERAAAAAGSPAGAPGALFNLANTLAALGRVEEALGQYERALELAPRFREARLNKASALARQGRRDEALREIERALDDDPAYAPALLNLALLSRSPKVDSGAAELGPVLERVERALAIDPSSPQIRMLEGDLLLASRRPAEAAVAYRSVIEMERRSADAWAHLGRALADAGKHGEAEAAAREALAIDSDHAVAGALLRELAGARGP